MSADMKQSLDNELKENIVSAIDSGLDYLFEHQYPNGEFCTYMSPDDAMQEWCYPDSNVFCTSVIAGSLLKLKREVKAAEILDSVGKFLYYQMMRGGMWNYFTKFSLLFKYSPPDVDTTVYTSMVLQQLGVTIPDNKKILLQNRAKNGLFYTWIIWRPGIKLTSLNFKIFTRELKRPLNSIMFWLKNEVNRNDTDAIVNANALYYFGSNKNTDNIVAYLLDILQNAKEDLSDKWYKNPIIFYYFLSRNFHEIKELAPAKPIVIARLLNKINQDGSFGQSDLENGMALVTLLNANFVGPELHRGIYQLLKSQSKNGSWKRFRLFYCGPSKKTGYGSEEITTAFCLEALAMYSVQEKLV